ncbi:MAG: CHAP domain-containing protein [Chloroflexi bacterium]|nr:CHAP domain-containing protein [Chloroflexota bacterium]
MRTFRPYLLTLALIGLLAASVLRARADSISTAQDQIKQSTAARQRAEQQLQATRGDISAIQAQINQNRQQFAAVQSQVAKLERQANATTTQLSTQSHLLMQQLDTARQTLDREQADMTAQEAAVAERLTNLHQELMGLQQQIKSTQQQQQQLNSEIAGLQQELTKDEAALQQDHAASNTALVQLYKFSQVSALDLLLSGRNLSDGLNQVTLLGRLAQHDTNMLLRTSYERDLVAHHTHELQAALQAAEQLSATLHTDQDQLRLRSQQEESLLVQLRDQLTAAKAQFAQQSTTLNAQIASLQQRLAAVQRYYNTVESPLRSQQVELGNIQSLQVAKLGHLQQEAALASQQAANAQRQEAAARASLQRLQDAAAAAARNTSEAAAVSPRRPFMGNLFPYGQCTWWAIQRRPDLSGSVWGNAWQWVAEARSSGRAVGAMPRVGAIAVFQPGVEGADWYGHVGYVTAVGSNGWFQVSEMNFYAGWARVDLRWAHDGWGVSFIY